MAELVIDRTAAHVSLLKKLEKIEWYSMTAEQRVLWYSTASKGAYNYTDLNRVERTVAELAKTYGLTLTTKTDWTIRDIPTQADMTRYLDNVKAIQKFSSWEGKRISLPDTMANLTYEDANNIEKVLLYSYPSGSSNTTTAALGTARLGTMRLGNTLYSDPSESSTTAALGTAKLGTMKLGNT